MSKTNTNPWVEIRSNKNVEDLDRLTYGFEDAVPVSMHWTGAEKVNEANELELKGFGDLEVNVQSQNKSIDHVLVLFVGVRNWQYHYDRDYSYSVELNGGTVGFRALSIDVVAEKMFYRISLK